MTAVGCYRAHLSSQAVAYTPQGLWALALVPLAGSTIRVALHINENACNHLSAFRMRNAELRITLPFA